MMSRRVVVVPGPVYRPPAFRPPSLRLGARELGQSEIKVNWGNLGQTILFGTMGVGAIYGSGLLPDPVKTIAMVGGVGLLGYAAYSFIGSGSKQDSEVPSGTGFSIPTPSEFAGITGEILYPKTGSRQGFNWFSDTYAVQVLLSNPSPKPVLVTLQLVIRESPYVFIFVPARVEEYVAETKTMAIPAGGNITVSLSPATKTSRWVANLEMDLTLRIVRVGKESRDLDHTSFNLIG